MKTPFLDEKGNIINFYDVLNVPFEADKAEIRSSFCLLIKLYHPDISGRDGMDHRKKIDLLIHGYKILADSALREEYDRQLFAAKKSSKDGFMIIPKKRIKYSVSLNALLRSRLLNKKIRHKELLRNFGQDIEVFVTPGEARKGALAYIGLPSRIACPLCFGQERDCNVCHGVGRIGSTSMLELRMPPPIEHDSYIEFDLLRARPDRFTSFTMKTLKVKISIIGKK